MSNMARAWTTDTIHLLTQDEMRALLRASGESKRDRAIFLLAYRHGLRASEIGLSQIADVDLVRHEIRLYRKKKSHSNAHPMQADEVKAVKAMLRERHDDLPVLFTSKQKNPISRRMLDVLIKRYGEKAGIPPQKRHFHVLKHSIATHMLMAGLDPRFIQNWLGHASIESTLIYVHLVPQFVEEQARKAIISNHVV